MRNILLAAVLVLGVGACARKVEVESAPAPSAEVSLRVTNTASQPVSVYVTGSGPELFVKQVAANTTEIVRVPGIAAGSTVRLRAALADGSRSYTREGVVLSGTYEWRVP